MPNLSGAKTANTMTGMKTVGLELALKMVFAVHQIGSVLMGEGRTEMLNDMRFLCQRFTGGRSHYNNYDRRKTVSVLYVSLHFIWRDL